MVHGSHHDLKVYGGIRIYAGEGSPELAQRIADYLKQPLSSRQVIQFPNENIFVKLGGSARGQDDLPAQAHGQFPGIEESDARFRRQAGADLCHVQQAAPVSGHMNGDDFAADALIRFGKLACAGG